MIDLINITFKAGDGGHGRVSFHREKYILKGGPSGGYGGNGGSIILKATRHHNTLKHLAGVKQVEAKSGKMGAKKKQAGGKAEDIILEVPLGTVVNLIAENGSSRKRRQKYGVEQVLNRGDVEYDGYSVEKETEKPPVRDEDELKNIFEADRLNKNPELVALTEENQEVVISQGGFGGRGNTAFRSSRNTTPLEAEYGTYGEIKQVSLELKLLADIGLVGYPNAGKSTLLSKITKANPKTANYPFTTLEPNLGVLSLAEGHDLIVADIPGLIEGASEGKGLGHDFLRHVENTQTLLFVLFLEEAVIGDESLDNDEKADLVWKQYQTLKQELKEYSEKYGVGDNQVATDLQQKPFLVSLNKIDIYSEELIEAIKKKFTKENKKLKGKDKFELMVFSGFTGKGLDIVLKKLAEGV